jgi:hypothetical protein
VFVLIAIIGVISWTGFLVVLRLKAPAELRPVAGWVATAGLLVTGGVSLAELADQQHWTLHHSALGVAAFLLPVSGLACLGMAAATWHRRGGRRSA